MIFDRLQRERSWRKKTNRTTTLIDNMNLFMPYDFIKCSFYLLPTVDSYSAWRISLVDYIDGERKVAC